MSKKVCFFCGPGFMLNYHTGTFINEVENKGHNVFRACIDKGNEKNIDFEWGGQRDSFSLYDLKRLANFIIFLKKNSIQKLIFFSPKASLIGAIVKLFIPNIKSFFWHRGIYYENWTGIKFHIAKLIDLAVLKLSTESFFCSKSQLSWLKTKGVISKNVTFNRKHQSFVGIDIKTPYVIKDRPYLAGYLGRLCKDKGFDYLWNLYNYLKANNSTKKILIKGSIDTNDKEIQQKINEMIASKYVDYEKWSYDISEFFGKIKIHFFPTLREGFGNVAVEAAIYGVPTIAVKGVGLNDSVSNSSGILVDKHDDLIEGLFSMEKDKFTADYEKVSKSSIEWARNNFNKEDIIEELLQLHEL